MFSLSQGNVQRMGCALLSKLLKDILGQRLSLIHQVPVTRINHGIVT